jgi:hypothetical protein
MKRFLQILGWGPRPAFFSPRHLFQLALSMGILFLAAHIAGLRAFTSVLNGTVGSTAVSWRLSAFFGVVYVLLYLAFVVLAPVMLLAAGLLSFAEAVDRKANGRLFRTRGDISHPMDGPGESTGDACSPPTGQK